MIRRCAVHRDMVKRFSKQFLVDLGEMEGDYRAFHLKDDIAHSTLYMLTAIIGVFGMLRLDAFLYEERPDLFWRLLLYRGIYVVISVLMLMAVRKVSKIKVYDRFVFSWICITSLCSLLCNLTHPPGFSNTAVDVLIPFAIYIFSPLKLLYNFLLALGVSVGSLSIDGVLNANLGSFTWNTVLTAQFIAHGLGVVSAMQIQSYRRKSFKAYIQEKDLKEQASYMAKIDPLTKSLTRSHFFNTAENEFLCFIRYRRQFSIMVLDADHFKKVNDTHGHYAGDLVLRNLSLVILEQKRAQDSLGRLGGEEFGVLLPETNLEQALVVAQRVQKMCEQAPCIVDGQLIYSTISIGVAEAGPEDRSFEDVLRRADRMMYKAKEAGRNQVVAE
jgi:diguanylate cyclase (GGDEF)-like protein